MYDSRRTAYSGSDKSQSGASGESRPVSNDSQSLDGFGMDGQTIERTPLEAFIARYRIESSQRGVVSLHLDKVSREEFIVEASRILKDHTDKKLIKPEFAQQIRKGDDFIVPVEGPLSLEVNPDNSHLQTIKQRRSNNLGNVLVADATVAFLAYEVIGLVNNREDLFGGRAVQCKDGFLYYHENTGLYRYTYDEPKYIDKIVGGVVRLFSKHPDEKKHLIAGMRYI